MLAAIRFGSVNQAYGVFIMTPITRHTSFASQTLAQPTRMRYFVSPCAVNFLSACKETSRMAVALASQLFAIHTVASMCSLMHAIADHTQPQAHHAHNSVPFPLSAIQNSSHHFQPKSSVEGACVDSCLASVHYGHLPV
jgi:hypothetical protein